MVRIIQEDLKGVKDSLRIDKPGGSVSIKVWTVPEFIDELEDVQAAIPDMKEKESY